jgi:hypothetical protein
MGRGLGMGMGTNWWGWGGDVTNIRVMPNQVESRWISMVRSVVSNAADRSRRVRHVTCLRDMALMMWLWIERRVVSVEWCFV